MVGELHVLVDHVLARITWRNSLKWKEPASILAPLMIKPNPAIA
jgi:hypothetical protein